MRACPTCEEHNELCHLCWKARALAMERRALDAEQRLKDAAKVCRQRTAERDEARHQLVDADSAEARAKQERDEALLDAVKADVAWRQAVAMRDEARQVAHELCFPPDGRTQAALREICERHPWICRDKEPW